MRTWGTLLVAAALIAAPTAAHADSADNYTPVDPSGATLAGSVVTGECRNAELWLAYTVTITDPDDVAASTGVATLVIDVPGRSVPVTLGPLTDGSLAGSMRFPAATGAELRRVAGGGTAATTVNATIQVQPASVPALAYPITLPACGAAPASTVGALAVTGTSGLTPVVGLAGGALIALGSVFALLRLRSRRPH